MVAIAAAANVSDFAEAERSSTLLTSVGSPAASSASTQAAEAFAGFGNRVDVSPRVTLRQVSTIVVIAFACWLTVFAAGHALLG